MDLRLLGIYLVLAIIFYILTIRPFMLARRKFKCQRCGRCCKLKVPLKEKDIKRLESSGKKDFVVRSFTGRKFMKRINGYCKFLEFEKGLARCTVNDVKPEICASWPIHKGFPGTLADCRCKSYWGKWF